MKFVNIYILSFFLILSFSGVKGQNYDIESLGTAINSEYEEINPVLSGDGTKLYFVRANHPDNRYRNDSQDIWYSEKGPDGEWSDAVRLSDEINLMRYNAVLWSNSSGDELIIQGEFDPKTLMWKKRGISTIRKENGSWSRPDAIKIKGFDNINDGAINSVGISESGTMMVLAFSSVLDSRKSDIYVSIKLKNGFSRPVKIKDLSSKFDDQAPYINADHNKIYFASNRPAGAKNYNIYTSEKQSPEDWTMWSEPQEVDFGINTDGYESYFTLIDGGKAALFVTNQNTIGNSDIYKVVFEESKPEEIVVNARIIDGKTRKPLPVISFDLMVNQSTTSYLIQNPDSAVFQFSITEGEADSLEVAARISGYAVSPQNISVEQIGNNIYDVELIALREKMAPSLLDLKVSGLLIDRDSRTPIPVTATPVFRINDYIVDSVKYNPYDGSYELFQRASDSTLVLSVAADGYLPYTKALRVNSLLEISHNIELRKRVTGIVMHGLLINTKTQRPVDNITGIKIIVNGKPAENVTFLNEEKSFQLYLNKDSLYVVSAQLPGYFGTTENVDLRAFPQDRYERNLLLTPVEAGQTVKLNNIFFNTGSFELLNESIPELNRVADFLRENPSVVIEIAGHTDNIGSDTYNQKLSEERAKSVARYIILKGFTRERIEFKGYGEANPVASNDTADGREQNRRVEFKVLRN